jgi:ABC-type microcin C transport system permease subunit YejB
MAAPALTTIVVQVAPGGLREQARACVETLTRYADRELEIKVVSDGDQRSRAELSSPQARYVAVIDADAVVTPGWLAPQIDAAGH